MASTCHAHRLCLYARAGSRVIKDTLKLKSTCARARALYSLVPRAARRSIYINAALINSPRGSRNETGLGLKCVCVCVAPRVYFICRFATRPHCASRAERCLFERLIGARARARAPEFVYAY